MKTIARSLVAIAIVATATKLSAQVGCTHTTAYIGGGGHILCNSTPSISCITCPK